MECSIDINMVHITYETRRKGKIREKFVIRGIFKKADGSWWDMTHIYFIL